MKRDCWISC